MLYLVRRTASIAVGMLLVSVAAFMMLHLVPGDPVALIVAELQSGGGGDGTVSIEQMREELGLNEPLVVQYFHFVANALQGDFGRSLYQRRANVDIILAALPHTLQLAVLALLIAVVIGVTLGVIAARHSHTWADSSVMGLSLIGVSMPNFWLGLMLIIIFAGNLRWFPTSGQGTFAHLVLPAVTLGVSYAAVLARLTRAAVLEAMRQDYILTARGKGLGEGYILVRHGLRNALIPVLTMIGLQFGNLLAGAFVIEVVFARNGIGTLLVNSILARDFPLAQATILLTAVFYLVLNLVVDLLYSAVDPRVVHK